MKRGKRTGFGTWCKAEVQRKRNAARLRLKQDGQWIELTEFPKNLSPGIVSVQFIEEKRKVNTWKPLKGVFEFTTEKFAHKEGQTPVPKPKVDNWGKDYYEFTVVLKFTNKKYAGCTVPYNLYANFQPVLIERKGKEVQALGTFGGGKPTEQLEEYLNVAGIWDRDFPYKDNPLPMLQKAILEVGATFQGQLEKGWITSLYSSMKPTEDNDFGGGDTAPWED